jgi:hypothetical protein
VISRSKLAEEEAESVLKPTGSKPIQNLSGLLNKLENKLTATSFMTGKPSTTELL